MTKLFVMRRGMHLEPATAETAEALERIPQKKMIEVEAIQRRNVQHSALYWSLLHRVAEYLDQADVTADVLHELIKLGCGVIRVVRMPDGTVRKLPGSIAFSNMDQIAFSEFFEKAVRYVYVDLKIPPAIVADLLTPTLAASEAA